MKTRNPLAPPSLAALLLAALVLAAAPALAHGDHGEKGEACKDEAHHVEKAGKGAAKDGTTAAPRSFASKPKAGTMATCPVSGEVFKTGKKTKLVQHAGRWYAFCCPDCDEDFAKDPAKYADATKS